MRRSGFKYAIAIGAVVIGVFVAAGLCLSLYFELSGFGTPRDVGPRYEYLLGYSLGIIASLLVPLFIWRRLIGGMGT